MEEFRAATPHSAHRVIYKVLYAAPRDIHYCAVGTQASPHDHEKSQDVLRLLSVRNVFWQHSMAQHLSQEENKTRRFRGLDSDGPELLYQILDSARVTAPEKRFLQSLTGEDNISATWTTKSRPPQFPLDPDNRIDASTVQKDSDTSPCFGVSCFEDPITGEDILSPARAAESSFPRCPLDRNNGLEAPAPTVHEDSDTISSPRMLHFDDATFRRCYSNTSHE